jgi:N6-adenosine-specific RNA methylase IME4
MKPTIDPEFKALIPPLAPEELAQLEANILRDGCRDPLVVWPLPEYIEDGVVLAKYEDIEILAYGDEDPVYGWRLNVPEDYDDDDTLFEGDWPCILIDGHNRHAICTRYNLPFEAVEMEFVDRSHAKEWIIRNQFGRRNLLPYIRTKLALELEETIAARAAGKEKERKTTFQKSEKSNLPPVNATKELAAIAGVSHDTVAKVKKIEAKAAPEIKEKLATGEISINQAHLQITRVEKEEKRESRREENRAKVAEAATPEAIAESGAKFATIMIDPPWDWGDEGDQDQLGRARPDYATMSKDQLLDLPLPDLADDDCHLYLWITNRSLPKGFELMERWGFRYVTAITWAKPHFGMGNYFRGQTEHILFGVKGSQPLKRKDVGTLFNAARGKGGHSSKPTEFYDLVESCSPGPYLEMFSRSEREGWKAWGENA